LAIALVGGAYGMTVLARDLLAVSRTDRLRAVARVMARRRGILIVVAAVIAPVGFLMLQHTRLYDGIRHVLFVIPMLAVVAGAGLFVVLPWLRRIPYVVAVVTGLWVGNEAVILARLHPLEYVAMNIFAGRTPGAYGRFELDYFAVAATEALRRLESRLKYEQLAGSAKKSRSVLVCIPWREWAVAPMLTRPWTIEVDADKADFVIETERWRCAEGRGLHLIDEVKRFDRAFAWTYARRAGM
jgi:hypothetical protein